MRSVYFIIILTSIFSSLAAAPGWAAECVESSLPLKLETEHFNIEYALDGEHGVSAEDEGSEVSLLDGTVIGWAGANNGLSDYVEGISRYLEYAYEIYEGEGLLLPVEKVRVQISGTIGANGLFLPDNELICIRSDLVNPGATAVHELFHGVQYSYWSTVDFGSIPATEQAFYKEGTADWAMIQLMHSRPYFSWFNDADLTPLFELGSSSAFFWIYYLERLSEEESEDEESLSAGFGAMREFLERVAEPDLNLLDALILMPEEHGSSLAELIQDLAIANLTAGNVDPELMYSIKSLQRYVYKYAMEYGFGNQVRPLLLSPGQVNDGAREFAQFTAQGVLSNRFGAEYYELELEGLSPGCKTLELETSGDGLQMFFLHLFSSETWGEEPRLQLIRIDAGTSMVLPVRLGNADRVWFVVYSPATEEMGYDIRVRLDSVERVKPRHGRRSIQSLDLCS